VQITLCTIGFTGKTAEEFFRLLAEAGVRKVVDVRENRIGQLSGYAKHPDLEFFLQRIGGLAYNHEALLAPSAPIREAYRASKDWAAYESAFLNLMRERNVPAAMAPAAFAGTVALLCSEPGPEKCHRRLVADLLAAAWRGQGHAVEVRHLVSSRPPRAAIQRPRKRGGAAEDARP
jgi:uncharacterized protein (DUF488 family)